MCLLCTCKIYRESCKTGIMLLTWICLYHIWLHAHFLENIIKILLLKTYKEKYAWPKFIAVFHYRMIFVKIQKSFFDQSIQILQHHIYLKTFLQNVMEPTKIYCHFQVSRRRRLKNAPKLRYIISICNYISCWGFVV